MAVSGWVRKGGPIYARIWILIEKLVISLMIMDIFQASLFKLGSQVHNKLRQFIGLFQMTYN